MTQQQRKCHRDEERPCNATCAAYNETELEGSHCLELAAGWARARGTANLAQAINRVADTALAVMQAARG